MSSTATPTGAEPVGTLSSSGSFSGKFHHLPIASGYNTAIFYGDFVKVLNGGTIAKQPVTTSIGTITIGIFLGCSYTDPNTQQWVHAQQWTANTVASDAVAYVADDPFLVFKMQGNAAMPATDTGLNVKGVDTAGDLKIGRSKNALDGASVADTDTFPFRILEHVIGPDSDAADTYPDVLVTWLPGKHAYLQIAGI